MSNTVDNSINNNDVIQEIDISSINQQESEKNTRFIELERQFNEIKDFLGTVFQNGTKKIKESFATRNKKRITIDDLDIGSHPVIIEKFAQVDLHTSEIKERLSNLELQLSQMITNNTTNAELYQRRYENMTEMISDNYYNTNKKFDMNATSTEHMKTNINKINKILEYITDTRIDPIENRVDNIETSLYQIRNGVDYIVENVDPKQIKQNTDNIYKLLENHDKIASDIVTIRDDNKSLDEKIEEHKNKIEGSIIMID